MIRTTLLAALAATALLASDASAQIAKTIEGRVLFHDIDFDMSGNLPGLVKRPARRCIVELALLAPLFPTYAFTETDEDGNFSLPYAHFPVNSYQLRVLPQSDSRGIEVLGWATVVEPFIGSVATTFDVGTKEIGIFDDPGGGGRKGSPFGILDELIDAVEFTYDTIPFVQEPKLVPPLLVSWPNPDGDVSFASGTTLIVMGNDDGLDDTVVQHEFGHIATNRFSKSDSPGGPHSLCDEAQHSALAWGEGVATFLGSNVRKWQGHADPGIYVDTDGTDAIGNATFSYRLEDATNANGGIWCNGGPFGFRSELAVQLALWDLSDAVGDNPLDPTNDDDLFDGSLLVDGVDPLDAFWNVFSQYLPSSSVGGVDMRDFWDGWWQQGFFGSGLEVDAFLSAMDPWMERELTVGAFIGFDHYSTVAAALADAPPGAVLRITPGSYPATLVHDRRLSIEIVGGASVILGP